MAYKCSFLDNETYVAQDVNDIFARITSGGVVFTDTGYTFGDLNGAQSEVTGSGVTRDTNSCKVVKNGDTYKISKGACFMNDGSAIIFDEEGQEIEITPNVVNYVYLMRNVVANTIDIVVSEIAGDEDSIPLAEIGEKGEIFDRRKYSRAKVDLSSGGNLKNFTANFKQCSSNISETATVYLPDGAFSYLIIWSGEMVYGSTAQKREANGRNLIELKEGEEVRLNIGRFDGEERELVYLRKDGRKIHIYLIKATNGAEYTLNMGVI